MAIPNLVQSRRKQWESPQIDAGVEHRMKPLMGFTEERKRGTYKTRTLVVSRATANPALLLLLHFARDLFVDLGAHFGEHAIHDAGDAFLSLGG